MKVFGQYGHANTNKVLAAAALCNQTVTFVAVANPKDKAFLAKNPLGTLPILETSAGVLTSVSSILKHLSCDMKAFQMA